MENIETKIVVSVTTDTTLGEYLEWSANKHTYGEEYYFLPVVFKKENGRLTELNLDQVPYYIKHSIVKMLPYQKHTGFFSQNNEDEIIDRYFGQYRGTILEIGANNGATYSNSLYLIRNGWSAVLVEPSEKVFPALKKLHFENDNVFVVNAAIGEKNGPCKLFDSGDFLLKGTCSLLSTIKPEEIKRWGDVSFEETDATMITFDTLLEQSPYKKFAFISIDCEGYDLNVLRQIDLDAVGCKVICIEHNSIPHILSQMREYIEPFGFRQIGYNAENIIMARI